jgi:hypothetical protein
MLSGLVCLQSVVIHCRIDGQNKISEAMAEECLIEFMTKKKKPEEFVIEAQVLPALLLDALVSSIFHPK